MVISPFYPPYQVVLPNVPLKRFQLHPQIRFTSTATVGAATATVVPNGPSVTQFDLRPRTHPPNLIQWNKRFYSEIGMCLLRAKRHLIQH
jgi:hypothetical protein